MQLHSKRLTICEVICDKGILFQWWFPPTDLDLGCVRMCVGRRSCNTCSSLSACRQARSLLAPSFRYGPLQGGGVAIAWLTLWEGPLFACDSRWNDFIKQVLLCHAVQTLQEERNNAFSVMSQCRQKLRETKIAKQFIGNFVCLLFYLICLFYFIYQFVCLLFYLIFFWKSSRKFSIQGNDGSNGLEKKQLKIPKKRSKWSSLGFFLWLLIL